MWVCFVLVSLIEFGLESISFDIFHICGFKLIYLYNMRAKKLTVIFVHKLTLFFKLFALLVHIFQTNSHHYHYYKNDSVSVREYSFKLELF